MKRDGLGRFLKGENGKKGFKHSEESKLKMSNSHKGYNMSVEQKEKISLSCKGGNKTSFKKGNHSSPKTEFKKGELVGKRHHRYLGGTRYFRRNHEWKLIRKQVLIRFEFKCTHCGAETTLDIHHKVPYRKVQEHKLDNLIPLCKSCHTKEEWNIQNLRGRN